MLYNTHFQKVKIVIEEAQSVGGNDFPYVDTLAASMLNSALRRASDERGQSLRSLAKQLGYKQATVLSHMSKGRVPVPIERAVDIADVVGIPREEFFRAVVAQRNPYAYQLLQAKEDQSSHRESMTTGFVTELTSLAGSSLEHLNDEQKSVVREVMLDQNPARRWLTPSEMTVMLILRRLRPGISRRGLSTGDIIALENALDAGG